MLHGVRSIIIYCIILLHSLKPFSFWPIIWHKNLWFCSYKIPFVIGMHKAPSDVQMMYIHCTCKLALSQTTYSVVSRARNKDWDALVQWASESSVFPLLTLLASWASWKELKEQAWFIACPETCAEKLCPNCLLKSFGQVTQTHTCPTDK